MEKRKTASLNAEISLLGFGLMRLPVIGDDKSKIDYPLAQAMIDKAYKAGVNYFDTAYGYHDRMSQVFAGDTLSKYPRDSYYLATKMPLWETYNSPADAERILDEQLQKCKTSYFDFYLAHGLSASRLEKYMKNIHAFLLKKKEEGVIRRLGFSFHDTPEVLEDLLKIYKWDFVQIQLNYFDWEFMDAKRLHEILLRHNTPAIIMEPVKGGTLAKLNEKTMEVLKAADPRSSAASWAMRYAGSLPNVATVLSGMSDMEQVEDNLKTYSPFTALSEAERKVLASAIEVYRKTVTIPCTGCRYCMDCPAGVDIPLVFEQYNQYLLTKKKGPYLNQYKAMAPSKQAHNCVSCGKCVELCPQRIDIPKYMKEISAFHEAEAAAAAAK